jgi:hypothetical protein
MHLVGVVALVVGLLVLLHRHHLLLHLHLLLHRHLLLGIV